MLRELRHAGGVRRLYTSINPHECLRKPASTVLTQSVLRLREIYPALENVRSGCACVAGMVSKCPASADSGVGGVVFVSIREVDADGDFLLLHFSGQARSLPVCLYLCCCLPSMRVPLQRRRSRCRRSSRSHFCSGSLHKLLARSSSLSSLLVFSTSSRSV